MGLTSHPCNFLSIRPCVTKGVLSAQQSGCSKKHKSQSARQQRVEPGLYISGGHGNPHGNFHG